MFKVRVYVCCIIVIVYVHISPVVLRPVLMLIKFTDEHYNSVFCSLKFCSASFYSSLANCCDSSLSTPKPRLLGSDEVLKRLLT